MTTLEIVSRTAHDVGDDTFSYIYRDEYFRMLDRLFRSFCEQTTVLRRVIGFRTVDGVKSYQLNGPIINPDTLEEIGEIFGEELKSLYRVEYNSRRAREADFESIKNEDEFLRELNDERSNEGDRVYFAIEHQYSDLWMHFAHSPVEGDEVLLYYYHIPKIGTVSSGSYTPEIHALYHEDLVIGLTALAFRRLYRLALFEKRGLTRPLADVFKAEYSDSRTIFMGRIFQVRSQVRSYKDDTTPIVQRIQSIAEDSVFDEREDSIIDYD